MTKKKLTPEEELRQLKEKIQAQKDADEPIVLTCNQVRKFFSLTIDEVRQGNVIHCLRYKDQVAKVVSPDALVLPAGDNLKAYLKEAVGVLEGADVGSENRTRKFAALQALSELGDALPDAEPAAEG